MKFFGHPVFAKKISQMLVVNKNSQLILPVKLNQSLDN